MKTVAQFHFLWKVHFVKFHQIFILSRMYCEQTIFSSKSLCKNCILILLCSNLSLCLVYHAHWSFGRAMSIVQSSEFPREILPPITSFPNRYPLCATDCTVKSSSLSAISNCSYYRQYSGIATVLAHSFMEKKHETNPQTETKRKVILLNLNSSSVLQTFQQFRIKIIIFARLFQFPKRFDGL